MIAWHLVAEFRASALRALNHSYQGRCQLAIAFQAFGLITARTEQLEIVARPVE
jgi:hypothetical protein